MQSFLPIILKRVQIAPCCHCALWKMEAGIQAAAPLPAMAAIPLSENELRARLWHLSAQICLESHPTSNHIEY